MISVQNLTEIAVHGLTSLNYEFVFDLIDGVEIRDLKQNVTGIDESSDKYKQKGVTYADALRNQKGVTCADVLRKQKGVTYTDLLRKGNKDVLGEGIRIL